MQTSSATWHFAGGVNKENHACLKDFSPVLCWIEHLVGVRVVIDNQKRSHTETEIISCYENQEIVGLVDSRVASFRLRRIDRMETAVTGG